MPSKNCTPLTITEELRRAIAEGSLTRYEIWQQSGVDQAALSRFVNGKQTLTLEMLDRLAPVLGLTLVVKPPARPRKDG